jgi:hypothetical protein
VALLRLSRAAKRNALSPEMIAGIERFFHCPPDGTRAIVLYGDGDHFRRAQGPGVRGFMDRTERESHSGSNAYSDCRRRRARLPARPGASAVWFDGAIGWPVCGQVATLAALDHLARRANTAYEQGSFNLHMHKMLWQWRISWHGHFLNMAAFGTLSSGQLPGGQVCVCVKLTGAMQAINSLAHKMLWQWTVFALPRATQKTVNQANGHMRKSPWHGMVQSRVTRPAPRWVPSFCP